MFDSTYEAVWSLRLSVFFDRRLPCQRHCCCDEPQAIRVGLDGRLRGPSLRGASFGARPQAGGTADEGQDSGVRVPAALQVNGAVPACPQNHAKRGESFQHEGGVCTWRVCIFYIRPPPPLLPFFFLPQNKKNVVFRTKSSSYFQRDV